MTPAARLQTAIELLDLVIDAARRGGAAADTVLAEGFRARRYAGSGDRRAVRELVYRAIRRFGEIPPSGRAAMVAIADTDPALARLFDGSSYGPAPITADEPRATGPEMPVWLGAQIDPDEHPALLERAPLDLRVNTLKTTREAVLALLPEAAPIAATPHGVRLISPIAIESSELWRDGLVDVQDAGSQIIVAACSAEPGQTIIDLCAGAGGKTLALAADMAGKGRLIACDTDRARLSRLAPRAERAGAQAETLLLDGGREAAQLAPLIEGADTVLVDAPCSGSGTLRRNPEARWRITEQRGGKYRAAQAHVLALAAALVRPGGTLVYAVCSLLASEGRDQITAFLKQNNAFCADESLEVGLPDGPGRRLSPKSDGTDGFFVARLHRAC